MNCVNKLIGFNDFKSFSKVHTNVNNFICQFMRHFGNKKTTRLFLQLKRIDF